MPSYSVIKRKVDVSLLHKCVLSLVTCFTPCMVLRMNKVNIPETNTCGFLMLQAV